MYDVIVVGLGPAGSTAARQLAEKGFKILAVDRKRFPRYKPCGGGVTAKVEGLIGSEFKEVVERDIYGIRFTFQGKDNITVESETPIAYLVMRDRFDHFLMERARDAGVEVVEGEKVIGVKEESGVVNIITRNGRYTARFVVGSDGAGSVVASSTGLKPPGRVAVLLDGELKVENTLLSRYDGYLHFDFGTIPYGYGWVFPKKDGLSVGIGGLRGRIKNLRWLYTNFLEDRKITEQVISERRYGSLLPVFDGVFRFSTNRILLTGDAAALADPFTGEGIYYAVKSAIIASDVLEEMMEDGTELTELKEYDVRITKELCSELEYARRLSMIFHFSPRRSYTFLKENPELVKAVLKLAREEYSYSTLWKLIREKAGIKLDVAWRVSHLLSFFVE